MTPGVWERHSRILYLVDAPAIALGLGAALAGWGPTGILLALACGATREQGPIFAALYAWHPWPLIGLLAVPWWQTGGLPWRHHHLYGTARELFARYGRPKIRQGLTLPTAVYPWGGAILGLPTLPALVGVALTLPGILRSIDTVRLLMPALPLAILGAVLGATDTQLVGMLLWSLVMSGHWPA